MVSPVTGQGTTKAEIWSEAKSLCMGGFVPERTAGLRCSRKEDNLQEGRTLNLMHGFLVQGTRLHLLQNGTAVNTAGTLTVFNLIS